MGKMSFHPDVTDEHRQVKLTGGKWSQYLSIQGKGKDQRIRSAKCWVC
jgi:hypothetical protein